MNKLLSKQKKNRAHENRNYIRKVRIFPSFMYTNLRILFGIIIVWCDEPKNRPENLQRYVQKIVGDRIEIIPKFKNPVCSTLLLLKFAPEI